MSESERGAGEIGLPLAVTFLSVDDFEQTTPGQDVVS